MPTVETLVDTSVLLHYFRRNSPVAKQVEADYKLRASGFAPTVSIISVGELLAFAESPDWTDERRERLRRFIDQCVVVDVHHSNVLAEYARLHQFSKSGINLGQNDLWIAATAKAIGLKLLTSDRDFLRLPPGTVEIIQVHPQTGITEKLQ